VKVIDKSRFGRPVTAKRKIAAPTHKVWDVISMPGNLELCHPFCKRNPVQAWPGPNSRDEVHYLSGWMYERQFLDWIEGVGYDLEIGRPGGAKSYTSWRIEAVTDESCTLQITVYPQLVQGFPAALQWIPHWLRIRPMLKAYLNSVILGFEWFITRDEAVPRDHFGKHPWFSKNG
jgi:hypothetical protein